MRNKKATGIILAGIIAVSVFTVAIPGIASEPSNTPVTTEPTEEIGVEEHQQWVYDQGYNYTVAENWVTCLSPEERKALCGYKHLKAPTEPLPENVRFVSDVPKVGSKKLGSLPSSYDAMALGYVTPIKNQICGACWLHGAIADFESDVLINESQYSNLTLNFSEQEVGDCNIWASVGGHNYCNGGNALMTTNYFTKYGVANESCHPYNATPETCQNCTLVKNVDNWRIITGSDGERQINTIKNAIQNYGPVYSLIYARDLGFSAYDSGVYEYWGTEETSHAIEIIGWDDSKEHSHGTGAWLIKNSWGTDWGRNSTYPGCAWVAYGAANLGDSTSAISGYKNSGDIIFYYDECGWMWYCTGYGATTAYGAVRFTPTQNATLTAVDSWAVDTNMAYEIKIFDTLNTYPDYYTFSDQLGTTRTGTTNELGYYSIQLDTPVQLVSGDDFIVQVKLTTTGGGYPIPIDYCDAPWLNWSTIATSSGESYASCDGSQFEKYSEDGIDIGIRARAEVEVTQPDIWVSPTSFEKELSPDKVHSENLIIGNSGTSALDFEIQIDYVEQQKSSAEMTTFNAVEDINSDSLVKAGNGTGIAFVKCDEICKLVSLPSNNSEDSLSQIIVVNDTNYTLRPSEDKTATDTPGNSKLYLRYIREKRVLRESKGSSTDVWVVYGTYGTAKWDNYYLTGDISGTSYDFSLLASSDSRTDFIAKIKVDGTTLVTDYFTCDTIYPYFERYTGTLTGIDSTTFNGDEVTLEITFNGPYMGYIAYNGGSGDAADWYSYITIPPIGEVNTPPTACFTVDPLEGDLDTIFSFDAACSSDIQDPTSDLQVIWDWENNGVYDTSYTTTKTATHQYTSAGIKIIKLQVKDTGGLTNTTTKSVTVSPAEIHDMAVTSVCTSPSSPTTEKVATINVTVKNEGNRAESNVPVKAYVDVSQVDSTKYVSLSAGESTAKSFSWTPSTAKTYSVKGEVGAVSGETDTADNTKIIDVYVSPKDWLSVFPTTGTVNPGSQTNITVKFNTTGLSPDDYYANINITNNDPDESVVTVPVHLTVRPVTLIFDTGSPENPYPSIFGTRNGIIKPNQTITVHKLYTYPCLGTGGHSEYVAFSNATTGEEIANGTWNGYQGAGDYHYIVFEKSFMLEKGVTYNYTIRTGSYPQIHHTPVLPTANGWINCTEFIDANGKRYDDWIPAVRLE